MSQKTSAPRAIPDDTVKSYFVIPKRRVRVFIGREDILRDIEGKFNLGDKVTEPCVVVLRAMGGQGKTQVALEYCNLSKSKQLKGIFWIDATSENTLKKSFKAIAERIKSTSEIQQPDTGVEFVTEKLEEWLEPWLIVFDNYDNPLSYNLREYIPDRGNGRVLVTTRHSDADGLADPENVFELSPLPDSDALKLLLKQSQNEETESNLQEGRQIVERLGGHALAITQAVRTIQFISLFSLSHRNIIEVDC
jgi:hypothetical protein